VESTSADVLTVRFDGVKAGWEQWLCIMSDNHHDNKWCDRETERKHLNKALERNALIIVQGDLFCAMQGKYDPRSDMSDIRPEDVTTNYLDSIVNHAGADYSKYAKNILLLSKGNHEGSIEQRHGVSLLSKLQSILNANGGSVYLGGYQGWVRFLFVTNKTKVYSLRYRYHHGGAGIDSPVTRGVIQTARQAVYLPDADIVVNGHNHEGYIVPIKRERLSGKGVKYYDIVWYIRIPGYKMEFGKDGWADSKMKSPKPIGCCWVRLSCEMSGGLDSHPIEIECFEDLR
jgi:predicted phosphodiesterase